MKITRLRLFFPIFTLILASLACEGLNPITIDTIPVYPEAEEISEGNILIDSIAESIKQSAGEDVADVRLRMFTISDSTGWEKVKAYYLGEISGSEWKPLDELSQETDFVSALAWSRGRLTNQQLLVITYTIDPLGGAPLLFIALFNR